MGNNDRGVVVKDRWARLNISETAGVEFSYIAVSEVYIMVRTINIQFC